MSKLIENGLATLVVVLIISPLAAIPLLIWWYASSQPTTYCTDWVKVESIKPTNRDNGKHEDEQYIVTYKDGSLEGFDQGGIPYARCINKVEVHHSAAKSHWKTVHPYAGVDWAQ